MSPTFDQSEDVLRHSVDKAELSLVILTDVTGGTLRAPGALMAVTQTEVFGYISNGCVDADVISRARGGQTGVFIYGEGSPYRDIVLPCGGQLQIAIIQDPNREAIRSALAKLGAREGTRLQFGDVSLILPPRLKLRIAGRGAACAALAELARLSGFDVLVQSPDTDVWPNAQHLIDPDNPPYARDDARTAVVCLFHDHDWEAALLQQALLGPAFYIGALGSERTHEIRKMRLMNLAISDYEISRVKGPIGLVPSQRDARFLAVSILAEIIQSAQRAELL